MAIADVTLFFILKYRKRYTKPISCALHICIKTYMYNAYE